MENEKSLQIFNYQGKTIRTVLIDGEVLFFAADVCAFLHIKNVSQATSRIKEKHKTTIITSDSGSNYKHQSLCLREPGVYKLTFASRKAEAEALQDWIYEEVLPSLRKTGSYSIQPAPIRPLALSKKAEANEDRVPRHLFSIGCELTRELPRDPRFQSAQIPDDADIENSIRQCFWNDREKLGIPDSARELYESITPSGRKIKAYAYSIECLPDFRKWLHGDYTVCRLDAYLRNRAKRVAKKKQIRASGGETHLLPSSVR